MTRIIAGSRGGRRLTMPPGDQTRPTSSKVREALFSSLASWTGGSSGPADVALKGWAFCDLFAGSGAVGLEAASRGAAPVMLVESSRRALRTIEQNVAAVDLEVEIRRDAIQDLVRRQSPYPFDIVFLDPPYELANGAIEAILRDLVANDWLTGEGLVVLERSSREPAPHWPDALSDTWEKKYGETVLYFGAG
ncbi:putative RNA methyltransferase [Microlunatus phosphovorus NM-1]|uniref:Putative RNA methyltransferase n=2 Tax=Microlunatus phosphovorus TaxID=29405 RepID=F5XRD2_MICPN|nr:putative RNA methyltransferase [Microlunatus phosphovorus NM-1]